MANLCIFLLVCPMVLMKYRKRDRKAVLSISLLPQDENRWKGENPSPETFSSERGMYPLYHQWRTYKSEAAIIVNTHNTGTGKTKAALLRLCKRVQNKLILPGNDDV